MANWLKAAIVGAIVVASFFVPESRNTWPESTARFEQAGPLGPPSDRLIAELTRIEPAASGYYVPPSRGLPSELDVGGLPLSETAPDAAEADQPQTAEPVETVVRVQRGDTLFDLLLAAGVARAEAHEAVSALRHVYDPRDLKPGQEITLTFGALPSGGDQVGLIGANFLARADRDVNLGRDDDGRFVAWHRNRPLTREIIRATGTIRSSLSEAGSAAGIPGTILIELIRAFSYDVDFQRDIQPGDAFAVMFERFFDEQGRFAKNGVILYGALTLSGATKRVYRHALPDGFVDYYNERGESVRKALLRTPIDGARLTSGFGTRMHPILGYSAMHKGVDFGAPQGTPIQAAGDGVVEQAGANGAYGNYIRIRHNAEYATAYAHLSRYASGIRSGQRVRQGQIIGFVGATGRVTGAHLHYEVLRRSAQISPMSVNLPVGRRLEGTDLVRFRTAKADLEFRLADAPQILTVASRQ